MKFFLRPLVAGLSLLGSFSFAQDHPLKAGAATSNITPPLGTMIVGNLNRPPAAHIHDELHARCLVVQSGDVTLAFVVCDVLGLSTQVSTEARARIESAIGIPKENVLISATHTHSAGTAVGTQRNVYDAPLDDYQVFLVQRIADGVQRAHTLLRPAEVALGSVAIPEHVHNRRWIMKEGTTTPNPFGKIEKVKMNPPRASENLVEPAGPTDPTVSFLAFREPEGRLISVLAAYSLHYVGGVSEAVISADYFAVFSEHLKSLVDTPPTPAEAPFVAMMANGTSGDINNTNFREKAEKRAPFEQMTLVGEDIARKVHGTLAGLDWKKEVTLDARYLELPIQRREYPAELQAWAKSTLASEAPAGKISAPHNFAARVVALAKLDRNMTLPLQHLRIGEIGIGTFPLEVFAETGLEFKEKSPVKNAFMISLAHGYNGYLPTPRHMELGGYETWPGANHFEPQASVKMLEGLLGLARESLAE